LALLFRAIRAAARAGDPEAQALLAPDPLETLEQLTATYVQLGLP